MNARDDADGRAGVRDDLVVLLTSVEVATDNHGDGATLMEGPATRLADAILAAGWVPSSRLALVRDSVRDVSQSLRAERDRLAAVVERVGALADDWDRGDNPEADDDWRTDPLGCCADALRAALDADQAPPTTTEETDRG